MTSEITENAWRQSEDYFSRVEIQLQQRHEEILARRAALMSGREAFYDSSSGFPEVFIGSDVQARKRNEALFDNLKSIRQDLQQTSFKGDDNLKRLKRAYLQSVQDAMPRWIDQLREFKLRQIQKIGEERWNADEDYQAIDEIILYRPSNRIQNLSTAGSSAAAAAAASSQFERDTNDELEAVQPRRNRPTAQQQQQQLAASVPDLSASHRSSASAPPAAEARGAGRGGGGGGGRRLGAFLSSSWSNLRARMSRSRSGNRNRQEEEEQQQQQPRQRRQ